MRNILKGLFFILVLINMAQAKTFSIEDGAISFDGPKGFELMTPELLQIKYPRGNPPKNVLVNESTETSIVFASRGKSIAQSDIEKMLKAYEAQFKRLMGGFELKVSKVANISGQKWAQLEFISNTIDSKVYNIFLVTGYKNKMVVFNFNSTLKEFEDYKSAFKKSIKSITLK